MGIMKGGKGPREHGPNPLDEADAQSLDHAVETMIKHVLNDWDHTRPLGSLNKEDLAVLASAAIRGWICERSKLAKCGNKEIHHELNFTALLAG
ncbi:hypothetical protein [Halovulum sp. GXIMD14793]